ncbi:HlyD family type I secretion periplasmic adaptor subunit [Chitinibacter fontanus]|uniref:Membrane fusion protein (MFP) family protein n=1 Tax=Chitinibacter fontanus TaxID=1737446 RepID=A0A7D5ZFY6_9NEIS|nr:HlyD family type I secretion periplasmic adaptor subunit [Chitinibacter fontanus]QLI81189.1 HlyD family type I secretion periplasmic adaptor subunit [Chitinibacter fontanus]
MRFMVWRGLFTQYRTVFKEAWQNRKALDAKPRQPAELAFLPAALELQESPPHPAARITLYALISFLLLALLWACFGKIDIVAVAPGKLVVSDQSKTIQPLEPGVIKSILVQDGQIVKAGDVLIELDHTIAGAESSKNQGSWLEAKFNRLKAMALLDAVAQKKAPVLGTDPELANLPNVTAMRERKVAQMQSGWQELLAKLATIDADTTRKQAELASTQDQVQKLEKTLPIVRQREADFNDLANKNFISKHGVLEKQQARIEMEQDLASLRNKLRELAAGVNANQQQRDSIKAEFVRAQNELLAQATEQSDAMKQEVIKSDQVAKYTRLVAPVGGVVQQLAVHTIGGVVTAAQPLLVIVPQGQQLEAQAVLPNKDIGFVNVGQHAAIKVETFNYTKYGLLDGRVQNVSLDAIPDEKLGLVYQAKVKLERSIMNIDGKQVHLAPGMAVTVEIKTGQRRLIEYFLSPLIQHVTESVRER